MPNKHRHNVYVIELSPEQRFAKHKRGVRANAFVERYGVWQG